MTNHRKVALLDVDGVVADFTGHLLKLVGSVLTTEDVNVWQVLDLLSSSEKKQANKILNEPDFWISQPVLDGAREGVAKLGEHFDIYWATSPWIGCIGWDDARRGWLKKHFDVEHDRVAILSCKHICAADLFIDDRDTNIEKWSARNKGSAFLFDAPYNRQVAHPRMTWDSDIDAIIKSVLIRTA